MNEQNDQNATQLESSHCAPFIFPPSRLAIIHFPGQANNNKAFTVFSFKHVDLWRWLACQKEAGLNNVKLQIRSNLSRKGKMAPSYRIISFSDLPGHFITTQPRGPPRQLSSTKLQSRDLLLVSGQLSLLRVNGENWNDVFRLSLSFTNQTRCGIVMMTI